MDRVLVSDIHRFWFGDLRDGFPVDQEKVKRWWLGGATFDEQIRRQFGDTVERALVGGFSDWGEQPRPLIALLLLLDQFSRNIFRGTSRAFAGDRLARALTHTALEQEMDSQLSFIERCFLYMPLEHSELLVDQQLCVTQFQRLLEEVPEGARPMVQSNLEFAQKHRDIIDRFGRFPHRNAVLSRASTPEELEFLHGGASRFGQ